MKILNKNEVERISEHNYRLHLGEVGEIYGTRVGLTAQEENQTRSFGARASTALGVLVAGFTNEQVEMAIGASIDVNRPLRGKTRQQFLDRLTIWADESGLRRPSLQPVTRSIKLDWPGLSEQDIPRAMEIIADILGK